VPVSDDAALQRERDRQQALLQALWRPERDDGLQPWLREAATPPITRGLATYRANAGAHAQRALEAAFPTVRALIGDDAFAALARTVWRALPPERGDLACFGAALPRFLAADGGLPEMPWLLDSARLDALFIAAENAADVAPDPHSLALLGSVDAERLHARLGPGFALLHSAHPVVAIRESHSPAADGAHAQAVLRQALRGGCGQSALVWRQGWQPRAIAIDEADVRWCEALADDASFAGALQRAGAGFDVERWLRRSLEHGWLLGVVERVV
jgi:hypothetical protein